MAATSADVNITRYGLTQVYNPPGPEKPLVDIVFVHGLNGSPDHTWTSEKSRMFWPSQLLPIFMEDQRARILTFGYDADVASFTDGASRDRIHNHAENLIASLSANRHLRKATERPIIFVAHSLGGLVVKRALIYSESIRGNNTSYLRSIFVSTYAVLFMGTPHMGADLAKWGSLLEWICGAVLPSKMVDSEPQLVDALKKNSEVLQNIDRGFIQMANRFHIFFFHEGKKTNLKGTLRYVVDEESASPNIQDVERSVIQQDHSHMCKFENESAPGFETVAVALQRYADAAPEKIDRNWRAEKTEQFVKKRAEVEDILPESLKASPNTVLESGTSTSNTPDQSQIITKTSPSIPTNDSATKTVAPAVPAEPYFIAPAGLRPNTFFVGMEKEYKDLDRWLSKRKPKDAAACVSLYGQPGGGKSHLARQYVFQNKKRFPGGIFWITAKSREEMRHAFWDILQKVILKESPDYSPSMPRQDFVPAVKQWFESRKDWLMVFDGVVVDRDDGVTELTNFVPDSGDCSIIYVSRQNNLSSKDRLRRPHPIKVGPLKDDDAKKLLFKVLGKKKPTDAEQRKATELVKRIGGLPLIIDAIGHRLADTHEPLTKYKLSFSSDPAVESTYNQILDDLLRLEHTAAWNLFHILCWFGQSIPVEMVHLGVRILRSENIDVKSMENSSPADLNTTFSILMRYALIERNEPESESGSVNSSRDSLSEPIDMLKIHAVVQAFCCESLYRRGMLDTWLGYAVKLFVYSYHQADIKIKRKTEPGRVSDYRYYLVHGETLWDHTERYGGRKHPHTELQDILRPFLEMIRAEIRAREPRSSQESLRQGVFQASIFDRTSSSSSSGNIGPTTPDDRPTPPPIETKAFGYALDKTPTDSPRSLGATSPYIRDLGNSPHRSLTFEDVGYESDREGPPRAQDMRPSLSEATARPHSRARADTTESQQSGWQLVPPSRKPRNRRRHRDLGTFRPMHPSGLASAKVSRTNVTPQGYDENRAPHRRESSPALKALNQVQSRTPSPPITSRVASFFVRRFSGTSKKPDSGQMTWAKVAAGKPGIKNPSSENSNLNRPIASPLQQRPSRDGLQGRSGNVSASSPLASEVLPQYPRLGSDDSSRQYQTHITSTVGLRPYSRDADEPYTPERPWLYDASSSGFRPPPMPLPIDRNTSIVVPYPEGPDYALAEGAYPDPADRGEAAALPESPLHVPTGYYSQPMSRDNSRQSHISVAETEPLHQGSFSPYMDLPGPHYTTGPTTSYHFPGSSSPRGRRADGRAYRKSPRTEFAALAVPRPSSSGLSSANPMPQTTYIPSPSQPASLPYPPPYPMPAPTQTRSSRASSTGSTHHPPGPGIALTNPFTDRPTNIIVGFDTSPHLSQYTPAPTARSASALPWHPHLHQQQQQQQQQQTLQMQMQFGGHAPIDLDEARRRTSEAEERLRLSQSGRGGVVGKAYPDVNLIPTGSSGPAGLQGMVSGHDANEGEGRGLGLEFQR